MDPFFRELIFFSIWTSFSPVEEVVPVGEDAVAGRPEAQQRPEQNQRVERQVEVTGRAAAHHRRQEVGQEHQGGIQNPHQEPKGQGHF